MNQGSSISQVFGFVLNDVFGAWEGQAMHANTQSRCWAFQAFCEVVKHRKLALL
jgi:hypothetical protein